MGPGLCSDLSLFLSGLPGLGMKTRGLGGASREAAAAEGPGGLWVPGRWGGAGAGGGCSPGEQGCPLSRGCQRRRSPAGRGLLHACSEVCFMPAQSSAPCLLRGLLQACSERCSVWAQSSALCLLCRDAEDILHGAGVWTCLPASTGCMQARIWHAKTTTALPKKRDPASACQERAGSWSCTACAACALGYRAGECTRVTKSWVPWSSPGCHRSAMYLGFGEKSCCGLVSRAPDCPAQGITPRGHSLTPLAGTSCCSALQRALTWPALAF